ncbi:hypothetical protein [Parvularcula sp. IMCC14364]|uniref:hypothetical protein n=1 Tax=Parvularcula sp. IMCC14364 TaxID=3067902 RepID=UPI002741241B|nr:hypothetical protein [Parvularcula sp. IMCC14364]
MSYTHVQKRNESSRSLVRKAASGIADIFLFIIILAFTGVTVIAVAIAAPLALGISAIIGSRRAEKSGWQPAKAT